MKTLETSRLILRKFAQDDFTAVHSYASCTENITYMKWGPNTESDTRMYIETAIRLAEETPCMNYQYAVVLKETEELIGGCTLHIKQEGMAEVGWLVKHEHWKQGYGYEMGKRMLKFGFDELNLHRLTAHCDAENEGSFRLMEKLGMRREGLFYDVRPANKQLTTGRPYSDELIYAILKSDWETGKEIAYYNFLPCEFNGFIDIPTLTNGNIFLICTKKTPANPEKRHVPSYTFSICKNGEEMGGISLRIGYCDSLYYAGQIGYGLREEYRGNGYAAEACKLLLPVAKAHKMSKLLITNNYTNAASRRVCEKLNARFVRMARLPEWCDLYKGGQRFANIFEWEV